MANPIAIAAALFGVAKITCPHCDHVFAVSKKPVKARVCPRCKKTFSPRK